MTKILDDRWIVVDSIENAERNQCVDIFMRPDQTYGFEAFRRDPEDGGVWTRTNYFAAQSYPTKDAALLAARRTVFWLDNVLP